MMFVARKGGGACPSLMQCALLLCLTLPKKMEGGAKLGAWYVGVGEVGTVPIQN